MRTATLYRLSVFFWIAILAQGAAPSPSADSGWFRTFRTPDIFLYFCFQKRPIILGDSALLKSRRFVCVSAVSAFSERVVMRCDQVSPARHANAPSAQPPPLPTGLACAFLPFCMFTDVAGHALQRARARFTQPLSLLGNMNAGSNT